MAVWGMHMVLEDSAVKAVCAAKSMIDYVEQRNKTSEYKWHIRVGMHVGDVVGGVVGTSKFIYDIFGDTVNLTSRLESTSEAMQINISEALHEAVREQVETQYRGQIYAKGIGNINMYFVK